MVGRQRVCTTSLLFQHDSEVQTTYLRFAIFTQGGYWVLVAASLTHASRRSTVYDYATGWLLPSLWRWHTPTVRTDEVANQVNLLKSRSTLQVLHMGVLFSYCLCLTSSCKVSVQRLCQAVDHLTYLRLSCSDDSVASCEIGLSMRRPLRMLV